VQTIFGVVMQISQIDQRRFVGVVMRQLR
jgi:hypothetical protein